MQLYDITIAANKSQLVNAQGSYIRYYAGSAGGQDPTVTVKSNVMSTSIILRPGQGLRLPAGMSAKEWTIGNYANAGIITGQLVIGDGAIDDTNIAGIVSVYDGTGARTKVGQSFYANGPAGPSVGNYSHLQLWNPAGSGKNAIVLEVEMSLGAAGMLNGRTHNVALTTLIMNPLSKFLGGAVASCQLRSQDNASMLGVAMFTFDLGTLLTLPEKFVDPIIVPPGMGLIFVPSTTNQFVRASFQFYEESL